MNDKGQFEKGRVPWNKGKKGLQVAWNKGKKGYYKHSEETKKMLSVIGKGRPTSLETRKRIREALKGRKRPELSGKNHPMWKGGKHINKIGYVLVHNPCHPHCNKAGYVYEHRFVMETYVGRFLKPKEVVHHVNGIKSDNRLENLALFSGNGSHMRFHLKK